MGYIILTRHSVPPDHLLLDSAPNLGPLISPWEINKFENCWYKSVRILEVLNLLFQQFLNLSSSQRDMSGPIIGALSNNRWSWGSHYLGSIVSFGSIGRLTLQERRCRRRTGRREDCWRVAVWASPLALDGQICQNTWIIMDKSEAQYKRHVFFSSANFDRLQLWGTEEPSVAGPW